MEKIKETQPHLAELQQLISEELDFPDEPLGLRATLQPITNGLGLESPPKKEPALQAPAPRKEIIQILEEPKIVEPSPAVKETLKPVPEETPEEPPPVPQPSFFRRLLAAVMDEIFIVSLWLLALTLTSNFLAGQSFGFSTQNLFNLQNPYFLQFALLEFVALWFCYLAVCIGAMDMTFGMWVWGVRVAYGDPTSPRSTKKLMRILFSFLFYCPVIPLFLLLFRRKGRNLLDILSGTSVYRSVV